MQIRLCFFFSSRRRHTSWNCDWSSDVCSSDLAALFVERARQDLLLDAGGIAGWRRPARTHIDAVEFEMRLVDRHWLILCFRQGRRLASFAMSLTKEEEEAAHAVASLVRRRGGGRPGDPRRRCPGRGPTG